MKIEAATTIGPHCRPHAVKNSLQHSAELSDDDIAAIKAEPDNRTDMFLARKYRVLRSVIQFARARNLARMCR